MSCHLVALVLFSVRHSFNILVYNVFVCIFNVSELRRQRGYLLNLACEALGRLESGNLMSGNDDGGILADVASGLLSTLLKYKATESTEEYFLTSNHILLNVLHE